MNSSPRLELITQENVAAACDVRVAPEQEAVVAPVVNSLAEAYASRETAWPRLIYDGNDPVGFVMANFDPANPTEEFRCGIWRLNIDAGHQGRGYGRFAVEQVSAEARRRGYRRITVLWRKHEHGPESFYLRLGFRPTGKVLFGETVGVLVLD